MHLLFSAFLNLLFPQQGPDPALVRAGRETLIKVLGVPWGP